MRKLVMLALLVAVLLPAGATLAAPPPPVPLPETPQSDDGGTVVPVDPPPFVVIDGILWKFKGPVDGHAGWLRMKVISSTNADLVGKKVKVKVPQQIVFSFAPGSDKLHVVHIRVWVPRASHGLVASAIELG